MPRLSSGVRLGIVFTLAALGACSDDQNPSPTSPRADALRPSLALSISSSNFQQCANGDNGGVACVYINGVLNDSKSLYHESEVIAERFVIPGLTVGHSYRLVFDYGWEKAVNPGHMNYDFLAKWDATLGALANPCGDPLGNTSADIRGVCNTDNTIKSTHSGANAAFQVVPDAIFTTNAPLGLNTELQAAIDRFQTAHGADAVRFDILGGSFPANAYDNVTYSVSGDDVKGRFTVRFTAGQTTVMLLWGGHFADIRDYNLALWDADKNAATPQVTGNLSGAAGQTGAPFQFSQQYLKDLVSGDSTGIGSLSNNIQGSVLEPLPKAKISIAPSATNGIGESHTFTVTLQKDLDDGAGYVAAAGEHVDVTLTPSGGAAVQLDAAASTCDNAGANTNASGQCTMVFTSNSAGTVEGTGTATLSLGGKSVSVSTNGTGDNSSPAVKTFLAGSIRWLKHNGSAQLLGGAVFTVCRDSVWNSDKNSGAGGYDNVDPNVCSDVTDNVSSTDNTNALPADRDGTAGEFEVGGLILGKYTVKEKTAPAGYILDPDSVYVALSTTTTSVTIAEAFVNRAPDAFITIGPTTATNDVGAVHTFTAVMTVDPDGGPAPVIGTITISVSPTPSTPGTTNCSAQVGPDQAGLSSRTCTRTINSNVVGTFTANASATATVGTVTLTRDTDPATTTIGAGPGGSGPAVKNYVAPLLSITKTPDNGEVHPGQTASFTITVTNSAAATGTANGVVMKDTLPAGLTWTSNQPVLTCPIDQVTVPEGNPPVAVSHDRITCNIGSLAPGASFVVTVTSSVIPASFIQQPPSPVGFPIEIDGNLADDPATNGKDWASLPATVFTCNVPRLGCDIDLTRSKNDNAFGQGSKEDDPAPSVVLGSIPNNKSDLRRFYVSGERFGTTNFLYFAWSRVQEPNGTTNMDIELNQDATKGDNGVTPKRTARDVLVRYDLSQGGTNPVLGFHKWVTAQTAGGQTPAQACEAANAFPCWDKVHQLNPATQDVKAAINTTQESDPIEGASLSARTFGEAFIDLQQSGIFQTGVCQVFGAAFLKSRSSDSFVAELKDFIAPIPINITNCAPVPLNNLAWASATNFAPTGGNLGDWISDSGLITVTENQSASLNVAPTGRELALGVGGGPMVGIAPVLGELDASFVSDALRPGDYATDVAEQLGLSEQAEQSQTQTSADGTGSIRYSPRWRGRTSLPAPTSPRWSPGLTRRTL